MFSDDGICVHDPLVMRRALEYATGLGVLIAQHAEEPRLTVGAVAHEGPNAARLGLSGWPRAAEESIVARDALLARDAGARVHICHASTAGTVEILRWAKSQGISITAEVTPHHLLLDDSRLATYDGRNRVNPPLRETSDAEALRQALVDGVIDCVATDHAPHAEHEKMCEFAVARPGMLGLQTALSVVVETMVRPGLLSWRDVARVMSENPARIVGLPDQGRPLEIGEPANLTVVDPDATWTVAGAELASRSDNTPYESMTLPGAVTVDAVAWQGHRPGWKIPGMNGERVAQAVAHELGTLVGSLIIAAVLAVLIGLVVQAMVRGWRHRAERQAELIGTLPPMPDTVGPAIVPATKGLYVGSTLAPSWQDRIAVGDLGYRTKAVLTRYPEGIMLQRSGAGPIWIPDEAITAIRTERGIAGKALTHQRHPGHQVAAAVGHRDRHRVPRRQPHGLPRVAGRGGGMSGKAVLVLDDGRIFSGTTFGAVGEALGEAVFSTGMSGYQETLTDPSYHRQIVVATAPQIGNTGWNHEDAESRGDKIWVAGYAVRDPSPRASNWRATGTLDDELVRQGIVGHRRHRHPGSGPPPAQPRIDEGGPVQWSRIGGDIGLRRRVHG